MTSWGVKGQGQTRKTLKLNISKTAQDRDMLSIEVKSEVLYGLLYGIFFFTPDDFQGSKVKVEPGKL